MALNFIVYAVLRGEYDDRHTVSILSKQEDAVALQARLPEADIEQWVVQGAPPKVYTHSVVVDRETREVVGRSDTEEYVEELDEHGQPMPHYEVARMVGWIPSRPNGFVCHDEAVANALDFIDAGCPSGPVDKTPAPW